MPTPPVMVALQARTDLERFGANAILLYALEMRFSIDDVVTVGASAITDGPQDRKCDLLYIERDSGTAVLAQAYISSRANAQAPANKAADLNTAASWVLGGAFEQMNESLSAASIELNAALENGEIEAIELWYCHNLPESPEVQAEMDVAASTVRALLSEHFPLAEIDAVSREVGINRLTDMYRSLQSPILVSDEIEVPTDGWFEEVGANWTAICTSVPANWLTNLFRDHADHLFSANVRGYMPSRRTSKNINHNIEMTARSQPGLFWAFNNGITGLVHDYQLPGSHAPGEIIRLTGLAIINGAQTTGALSRARASAGQLDDAQILARFIRCDDIAVVDDLIRFNNSQNPIKASDFRSMDQHQDRLRTQFQRIPDVTYLGARRGGEHDRARRPGNLLSSDTAAQCLAAFHGDPGTAYHQLRTIWERDEIYSKYFSDFTNAVHIVFIYGLLAAIQKKKSDLIALEHTDGLAADEADVLSFFRQRGSQFLLLAAIGSCMEILLSTRVPNRFALSFGENVSPSAAAENWQPIVNVVLPFSHVLRAEELRGSLRNRTRVEGVIENFRAIVRSTSQSNRNVFEAFRNRLS